MELTYKERQDLIWSLKENVKRLNGFMAGYLNVEPAYERANDQEGLERVRGRYAEAKASRERLKVMIDRLEGGK